MAGTGTAGQSLSFAAQGRDWHVEFDFTAIELFERLAGRSLLLVMAEIESGVARLSDVTRLLQAGLAKHHPDSSADDAFQLLTDPKVKATLFGALDLAMPGADGAGAGDGEGDGQGEA